MTSLFARMRCAICGFPMPSGAPLYRLFAFDDARVTIRADRCVRYDGPGHRECMLFAGALCPFFATAATRRTEGEAKGNMRGKKAALLGFSSVQIAMQQDGPNLTSFPYAGVVDLLWFDRPAELHGLLEPMAQQALGWPESARCYWKDEKSIRRAWSQTRALVASAGTPQG